MGRWRGVRGGREVEGEVGVEAGMESVVAGGWRCDGGVRDGRVGGGRVEGGREGERKVGLVGTKTAIFIRS